MLFSMNRNLGKTSTTINNTGGAKYKLKQTAICERAAVDSAKPIIRYKIFRATSQIKIAKVFIVARRFVATQ